jgi:hypothetical protein
MAPPSKQPDRSKAAVIPPELVKRALNALKDPEVQEEVLRHSKTVMDAAKRWRPSINDRFEKVGDRFGQTGLERRASNLQEAVTELSSASPALAATLRPVTESLNEVGHMLKVSDKLPFAKRRRAHKRIDDVLDDLESGLLDLTTRGARDKEA